MRGMCCVADLEAGMKGLSRRAPSPSMKGTSDPAIEPACDASRDTFDDGIEFPVHPSVLLGHPTAGLAETSPPSGRALCQVPQSLSITTPAQGGNK